MELDEQEAERGTARLLADNRTGEERSCQRADRAVRFHALRRSFDFISSVIR